jgi:hypothetical protein
LLKKWGVLRQLENFEKIKPKPRLAALISRRQSCEAGLGFFKSVSISLKLWQKPKSLRMLVRGVFQSIKPRFFQEDKTEANARDTH